MSEQKKSKNTSKGLSYPFGMNWAPERAELKEVIPGIFWIRIPLPFGIDHINLWLLEDDDGWTIVDTCINVPDARAVWEDIIEKYLSDKPVKRVIVTHMHPDHIGLAGWLTRKFDCELWMSRTDYLMCRNLVGDTGKEAPEDAIRFFRAAGHGDEQLKIYKERFGRFGMAVSSIPDSFRRMVDGETFEINGRYWQVVVGTGHSPEHVCLYCPGLKVLLSGDQVIARISSNVSVFPTEPDGNPLKDWLNSCEKLIEVLPGNLLVLPAHQEPFYGLHTRLTRLIEGHEKGLDRLFDFLAEPRIAIDCFSCLFKRKIGPENFHLATGETLAHLNCLIGRRLIIRERDENGVDHYRQRPDIGILDEFAATA